jgi:cation transport regulator ChaC
MILREAWPTTQAFDAELDVGEFCQKIYIMKACVSLAHSPKSTEATWVQLQLAGLEIGTKTQQLLATLASASGQSDKNLDILNKIFSALKQLRGMKEREETMRSSVTLPHEVEDKDLAPLLRMWLGDCFILVTSFFSGLRLTDYQH